jgi:hypothetical protein
MRIYNIEAVAKPAREFGHAMQIFISLEIDCFHGL